MTYKDISLFYFSAIQLIVYFAIFLLGCSLVSDGFRGVELMLPFVGTMLGLMVLVLGIVPLVSALLITAVSLLVSRRFSEWNETWFHHWIRSAGASLIAGSVVGLVAQIYMRAV